MIKSVQLEKETDQTMTIQRLAELLENIREDGGDTFVIGKDSDGEVNILGYDSDNGDYISVPLNSSKEIYHNDDLDDLLEGYQVVKVCSSSNEVDQILHTWLGGQR